MKLVYDKRIGRYVLEWYPVRNTEKELPVKMGCHEEGEKNGKEEIKAWREIR